MAARANYLAVDRADIQYAVKELARRMATPRSGDMDLMKRLGRYLVGTPRAVYMYPWQSEPEQIAHLSILNGRAAKALGGAILVAP